MQSVDRTEAQALGELMAGRRAQLSLRLGMALTTVVLFLLTYNDIWIFVWGAVYAALQATEVKLFPLAKISSRCELKSYRFFALLLLAANTSVFAGMTFVELAKLGSWSVVYGEAVVAATLLNVALTAHGCRRAFLVSMAPGLIYLIILPILAAYSFGCPLRAAIAIGAVGLALVVGTLKLWSQTGAAQQAERAMRLELQKGVEATNQNRAFLDAILEYVPSMLNVRDVDAGHTVLANRAMQVTTGKSRAE